MSAHKIARMRTFLVRGGYRGADMDVWYYDLSTGVEAPVTVATGDQELTDVSDGSIVSCGMRGGSHPTTRAGPITMPGEAGIPSRTRDDTRVNPPRSGCSPGL